MKFILGFLFLFGAGCGKITHHLSGKAEVDINHNITVCDKLPKKERHECIMKLVEAIQKDCNSHKKLYNINWECIEVSNGNK